MTTRDSRVRFEKWAVSEGLTVESFDRVRKEYFWPHTERAWRGWQAALSAHAPSVAVEDLVQLAMEWEYEATNRVGQEGMGFDEAASDLRNLISKAGRDE